MIRRREALLGATALLLALAWWNPTWSGEQAQLDALVVLDITQSMDAEDMPVGDDPQPHSRLVRSRALLLEALQQLPCGSRLGLGVFTEYRSLVLLAPVEVCAHFTELRGTLASIDSAMAWSGNSELAKGLYGALQTLAALPRPPALVFITDGHESPPLDPRAPPPWNGASGAVAGVVVGVGGDTPVPIPRHDPQGRPIGTWGAADVLQTAGRVHNPNDPAAASQVIPAMPDATPGREHLSSLREYHLQALARQTGLAYLRLRDARGLRQALMDPALAHAVPGPVSLRGPATGLAALLWLAVLLPALRQGVRIPMPFRNSR
ncbi:VWA domain-containing protein [Ideonella sp. 4Y11]|uniref:VWA domain-containing protein n=1 Tax=Ideonella aquatica TaxID=2824119 RepID=A0A940YLI2_9BURK|nr:VWA domain-containing protein [Ideonella aquatica]MBQ0958516.1 VWA domain-containing protein [Ideonella aquatica]